MDEESGVTTVETHSASHTPDSEDGGKITIQFVNNMDVVTETMEVSEDGNIMDNNGDKSISEKQTISPEVFGKFLRSLLYYTFFR